MSSGTTSGGVEPKDHGKWSWDRAGLWTILLAALASVTLVIFLRQSSRYPYYFLWDHDHGQCVDSLLIQSRLLPDHIATPGLGVNLIHVFTERVAHSIGWLSVLDLTELSQSLNPIAAVAERVGFMRMHTPFVSLMTIFCMWLALVLLFEPTRLEQLVLFLILASSEAFLYQSAMVRTELYSVFFWSVGVVCVAAAGRFTAGAWRAVFLIGCGIFLGLAYLTKMQSLLLLPFAPLLWFVRPVHWDSPCGDCPRERWGIPSGWEGPVRALAVANGVFLGVLLIAARSVTIPEGVSVAGIGGRIESYRVSLSTILLMGVVAAQAVGVWGRSLPAWFRAAMTMATLLTTGFLLSFLCHFLLYADPMTSWTYLRWEAKILFFSRHFQKIRSPADYLQQAKVLWQYDLSFAVSATLLYFGLVTAWLLGGPRRVAAGAIVAGAGMLVGSFLIAIVGARAFHRDTLWLAVAFLFCASVFWMCLAKCSDRRWLGIVGGLIMVLQIGVNVRHGLAFDRKLDALYTKYGWRDDVFFANLYGNHQRLYAMLMEERYRGSKGRTFLALRHQAANHALVRSAVGFTFPNQAITQRQIGVAARDQPVWMRHPQFRIRELPESLQGAFLVDSSSLPTLPAPIFSGNHSVQGREELVLLKSLGPPYPLVVLPRPDQEVYWFRVIGDPGETHPREMPTIVVSDGSRTVTLSGTRIIDDALLSEGDLRLPHFFLVKNELVAPTWSGMDESR